MFFPKIKSLKLWLGSWGGHDGAHASVSTSCFSVTCNAVDRPQNIVKRQCWNASHRNLNTWFLPWRRRKKQTKLQFEKGNHQIIHNMFYQCSSSFSTKSFRKRFCEECEVPTILLEKTYWIPGVNCWEILSFEHFQCRKSQQFNLACLDKHGNNFNVFRWPAHTHTHKKLSRHGSSLWSQGSEKGNKLKRAKTWRGCN